MIFLISQQIFLQSFIRRLGIGFLGFIYLILGFLLFSIIFWSVYLWLVKGKEKKE
ncbi:MAG: hypothetical protein N2323_06795 [candidate division WOR-3 bacterium]|nr:hypothetical protein [candidate division WOR-3 bacterium]MCX7837632.1 hypothetical protein [candidate division WOR-3 bacterium]MDW8114360.1 hypothetical protein [candidate division WOR-3 bacterium]